MGSPRFNMSADDWKKVGIGFLIAIAGAALAFIAEHVIPLLNEAENQWFMLLAALLAVAVNFLRKWLSDTRPPLDRY